MNLEVRNLSPDTSGKDVHLLHTKLEQLGYRIPLEEVERAVFGEGTRQAILDFQRTRGLQPTGIVDEHTAQIINAAVEAHRPVPERFIIGGQVRHQDGAFLEGMIVRVFDSDLRRATLLGDDALTDQSGRYEVSIAAAQVAELEKRRPDLLVRVFSPEGALLAESEIRRKADDRETVDLVVTPRVEIAEVKEQVHTVSLRLVDRETDGLLDGYTVRAFDLNSGEEPRDLGFDITNARGLFSIVYTSAPQEEEGRFRLHILNREGKEIAREEVQVDPRAEEVVEVVVCVPAVPERPSPRLDELRERLQLELPHELIQRLKRENISTIADIRKAGSISRLKDLPVPADHPAVRTLEAHANLSVLSEDVEMNEALIRRGFTDIHTIANTPGSVFLNAMKGKLDDLKAPQVYSNS